MYIIYIIHPGQEKEKTLSDLLHKRIAAAVT